MEKSSFFLSPFVFGFDAEGLVGLGIFPQIEDDFDVEDVVAEAPHLFKVGQDSVASAAPISAPNNVIKTLSAPTTVQKSHPELDLERLKNLLRIEARKYGFERSASYFLRVLYKQYRGHAQFVPMLDLVRKFLRQGYETEGYDLEIAAIKASKLIAKEEQRQPIIPARRTFKRLTPERVRELIANITAKNIASGDMCGPAVERAVLWVAGTVVRNSMATYSYKQDEVEQFCSILKEALIGALVAQGQRLAEAQNDASQKINFSPRQATTSRQANQKQPPPAILPRAGRVGFMELAPRLAPPSPPSAPKVEIKFSPKPEGGRSPEEIARFKKELEAKLQQKAVAKAAAEAQAEAKRQATAALRAAEEAEKCRKAAAKAAEQEKATKGKNKAKGRRNDH